VHPKLVIPSGVSRRPKAEICRIKAAVGQYSGINLLIPLCTTGLVWWGGSTFLKNEKKPLLAAFSVSAGHCLWLSLGLLLTHPAPLAAVGPDLVLYAIGLTWLISKPSSAPLYFLGFYQAISLAVNGHAFLGAAMGSAAHKALLVHLIWRTMALFLIAKLFLKFRQPPTSPSTAVPEQL
jgi:hypothetical protein